MLNLIGQILLFPFRLAALLLEILGRSLAILIGLVFFGLGALLCLLPPLIILGAPLCLISGILVVKAA